MSPVASFFSVLVVVPVEREHVLAPLARPILKLHANPTVLQKIKRRATDLVAETVPELQPIPWDFRGLRVVTKRVNRQSPDDGAVLGQNVEAQCPALDRGGAKHADVE